MLYKGPGLEPHTWQGLNNFLTLPYPCPSPLSVPKLKPPWESKTRITQIFFRESSKVTAFVQMIWKSCLNHSIFCSNFFFFFGRVRKLTSWHGSCFSHLQLYTAFSVAEALSADVTVRVDKLDTFGDLSQPNVILMNISWLVLPSLFTVRTLNPSTCHSTASFQEIQGIIFNYREHKLSVVLLLLVIC